MTRRAPTPSTKPPPGPTRTWPPTCGWCGWTGEPNDEQSPYLYCRLDPQMHYRDLRPDWMGARP